MMSEYKNRVYKGQSFSFGIIALKYVFILIVKNRFSSILRAFIKSFVPNRLVRLFDGFRMTSNERHHKDRLINAVNRHDVREYSYKEGKELFHCAELIDKFKVHDERPSDEKIRDIVDGTSSCEDLMKAYFNFFITGLAIESNAFRTKAVGIAAKNAVSGITNKSNRFSAIGAAIEMGVSKEILGSVYGDEVFVKGRADSVAAGLPLLSVQNHERSINESKYANILNNKKVAVVGPATMNDPKIMDEISKYDVLVFTNTVGDIGKYLRSVSACTLVVYYNRYNAKILHQNRSEDNRYISDFSVYRGVEYDFQVLKIFSGTARIIFKNEFFFNGAPQALQAILYDLAFFSPSEIKVFGFNLYVSNKPYRKNYSSPTSQLLYDLARHDPVGNFVFTKKLYESDFFKADNDLDFVLSLNVDEYLREIERNSKAWS